MHLIDVLIPFVGGLLAIFAPNILSRSIPEPDEKMVKRFALMRKCGFGLIGVSVLYLIILIFK